MNTKTIDAKWVEHWLNDGLLTQTTYEKLRSWIAKRGHVSPMHFLKNAPCAGYVKMFMFAISNMLDTQLSQSYVHHLHKKAEPTMKNILNTTTHLMRKRKVQLNEDYNNRLSGKNTLPNYDLGHMIKTLGVESVKPLNEKAIESQGKALHEFMQIEICVNEYPLEVWLKIADK